MRLHPAESRVRKLATETPAELMLFDVLESAGRSFAGEPLRERAQKLENFFRNNAAPGSCFRR